VKALATIGVCLIVASSALAQQNDITFKQAQGDHGLIHMEIGVSYAFPGLPPRTANSGVGTVRVTLPGATFRLESVDAGYTCVRESGDSITCSADGRPQDGGTAFPPSTTLQLASDACWAGPAGSADVWAAPDPAGAPDVSLPIRAADCAADPGQQPVQDAKESCKVPNVKAMTLARARRALKAGDCARGRVKYAYSSKIKTGRVISQSQRPGKTLKAGARVNLVVSRGKKP
jgi:hypothetical protein